MKSRALIRRRVPLLYLVAAHGYERRVDQKSHPGLVLEITALRESRQGRTVLDVCKGVGTDL